MSDEMVRQVGKVPARDLGVPEDPNDPVMRAALDKCFATGRPVDFEVAGGTVCVAPESLIRQAVDEGKMAAITDDTPIIQRADGQKAYLFRVADDNRWGAGKAVVPVAPA